MGHTQFGQWQDLTSSMDVIRHVRHGVPTPWLLRRFELWLRYRQQVDIDRVYPAAALSMLFDIYREDYLPEALAQWWLAVFGSDIDNARQVAANILSSPLGAA